MLSLPIYPGLLRQEQDFIIDKIKDNDFNFVSVQDLYPNPSDIEITLKTINENSKRKSWVLIDGYDFDLQYQNYIKKI